MTWKMYRITFRLLSPLHVGWFKQGNLQRTRPYVSGKALWGALTLRLTRDNGLGDYQKCGEKVNQELALSYFYPSTQADTVTLWPWEDPAEFAWRYLNTYASTALNYEQNSAEEGSLHETEYLAPYTRQGEPVYLVGYLFEREGGSLKWRQALSRLQVGGERKYGWGRLKVETVRDESAQKGFWPAWQVALSGARPSLRADGQAKLYAHLLHSDALLNLWGTLEPLVGRETESAAHHGGRVSFHRLAWAPGSSLAALNNPLRIGNFGLWELDS